VVTFATARSLSVMPVARPEINISGDRQHLGAGWSARVLAGRHQPAHRPWSTTSGMLTNRSHPGGSAARAPPTAPVVRQALAAGGGIGINPTGALRRGLLSERHLVTSASAPATAKLEFTVVSGGSVPLAPRRGRRGGVDEVMLYVGDLTVRLD
jgi:hypothetical protein